MLHDFFLQGYSKYTRNLGGGGFYILQPNPPHGSWGHYIS